LVVIGSCFPLSAISFWQSAKKDAASIGANKIPCRIPLGDKIKSLPKLQLAGGKQKSEMIARLSWLVQTFKIFFT
jgi:hypothetical protein